MILSSSAQSNEITNVRLIREGTNVSVRVGQSAAIAGGVNSTETTETVEPKAEITGTNGIVEIPDVSNLTLEETDYPIISKDYLKTSKTPIYEGANGIVLKGTDKKRTASVVIKIIKRKPELSQQSYLTLVFKEFEVIKKCTHKNVISILDIAVVPDSNEFALILPYFSKGDLLDYLCTLRRFKIEISASLKDSIFKQVVKGVKYLHAHDIVHRDLKPENCMIDADGIIKIGDFGYALDLSKDNRPYLLKNPHEIYCGTTSFKAPELFQYEADILANKFDYDDFFANMSISKTLDYWSLGIIYWNIFLMKTPWPSANLLDSKNGAFIKFKKYYPTGESQLKKLINELNDKSATFKNNLAMFLFKSLHYDSRELIIGLLNPEPTQRVSPDQLLNSNWLSQVYANPKDLLLLMKK